MPSEFVEEEDIEPATIPLKDQYLWNDGQPMVVMDDVDWHDEGARSGVAAVGMC